MNKSDLYLTLAIRRYKMMKNLKKLHVNAIKKLRKNKKTPGTFATAHHTMNISKEQKLVNKYNKILKRIRSAIYYDPNTFD